MAFLIHFCNALQSSGFMNREFQSSDYKKIFLTACLLKIFGSFWQVDTDIQ